MPGKPKSKASKSPKPKKALASMARPKRISAAGALAPSGKSAAGLIEQRIRETGGWRGATLAQVRKLILAADADIVEEVKWIKPSNPLGVPTWSNAGIICTGETYKEVIKLTFMRGASVPDPKGLFNASLDAGTRRAIDIHEGETLNAGAFKALVQAAILENELARRK